MNDPGIAKSVHFVHKLHIVVASLPRLSVISQAVGTHSEIRAALPRTVSRTTM